MDLVGPNQISFNYSKNGLIVLALVIAMISVLIGFYWRPIKPKSEREKVILGIFLFYAGVFGITLYISIYRHLVISLVFAVPIALIYHIRKIKSRYIP